MIQQLVKPTFWVLNGQYIFLASFLRSMTALLDPAEIEERDRRRQKQLEHQVLHCKILFSALISNSHG